jgi:hypothetical protein
MPKTFITTSWDDGNPLDFRVAEMLARHKLAGTFYIPRKVDTGVMSESEMRTLAKDFEIGAHTLNHVFLDTVDLATAKDEIAGSRKWVSDVISTSCDMFCPPAGRYNHHHLPIFASAGFTGIRTVEFVSLSEPRPREGFLEMPTTLQAHPQPIWGFAKNFIKRRAFRNFWSYVIYARSTDWVTQARRLLGRAIDAGGVFHLWGHSWELEQKGQWNRLDEVLRLMSEAAAHQNVAVMTNGQLCQMVRQRAVGSLAKEPCDTITCRSAV